MGRVNDADQLFGRLLLSARFLRSGISKALGFAAFSAPLAAKGLPTQMRLCPIALIRGEPYWRSLPS